MKLFLGLIAVLMIVGAGFLLLSGTQYRAAEQEMVRAREAATQARMQATDAERAAREPIVRKSVPTSETKTLEPAKATPPSSGAPLPPVPPSASAATNDTPAAPTASTNLSVDDVLSALPTAPSAPKPNTSSSVPTSAPPTKSNNPGAKPNDEPQFEITPTTIQPQDDGTSLVDGKYTIKGDGSAESPYVVPWELLTSAEHTYNPAEGKKKISEAITMLDGKHVKLNGFIAFPMMVQQPRELLSMLNQWDGCCIGVPPTPYDAVEVRLKDKVTGQKRFMTAGSITGIFRVKPYLTGKWLVGLWIMDDGEIVNEKYGAGGT